MFCPSQIVAGYVMYLPFVNVCLDIFPFSHISLGLSTSRQREQQMNSPYPCNNTDIIYYSLTSILLSHFILELRSIHLSKYDTSGSAHQATSVRFATNIEENLGASLHVSWAAGEQPDIDGEEDNNLVYFDHPLAARLIDIRIDAEGRLEGVETS